MTAVPGGVEDTGEGVSPGAGESEPPAPTRLRELLSVREQVAVGRSLLVLMQVISERYWGGSWVDQFEFELWGMAVAGRPLPDGASVNAAAGAASTEPADLCVLAELCGGWWTWEEGPVFVPLEEWSRRVEALEAGKDPREAGHTDDGVAAVPGSVGVLGEAGT